MKNVIICKSCQSENPLYELTCQNCKKYLRERVYNLDLWKLLEQLIENPVKGFTKIIYSEQKNFIFFILVLSSIKLFINTFFYFLADSNNRLINPSNFRNYLLVLFITLIVIFLFSLFIKFTNKIANNYTRLKDIISISSYSLLPHIFALILLFPLELIFFGEYLFSNNPSPFIIKETAAYIFLTLEFLIILWTIFLSIISIYTFTKSLFYSFGMGILFNLLLMGSHYLLSFFIFRY